MLQPKNPRRICWIATARLHRMSSRQLGNSPKWKAMALSAGSYNTAAAPRTIYTSLYGTGVELDATTPFSPSIVINR